ncbi:unnamed protein product [Leptidea sinapis]|uniref:Regulatory protein zeste n=1 Tax=Leptidea sinapis TaxID=189913 RepID=A0A5E4QUQ4_9NEOP|nr:unnamed protein product [Leptidea sinapis]
MESKPWIATGHARTARARERSHQAWMEITNFLNNSNGNGCINTWQQWQKYWKDKKGAVKRKCSSIAIARRTTGGGMDETAVAELTHLEQRIEAESIVHNQTLCSGQSQSILLQQNLFTVAIAGEEFTREISTDTSQAEEICQTPRSPAVEEQVDYLRAFSRAVAREFGRLGAVHPGTRYRPYDNSKKISVISSRCNFHNSSLNLHKIVYSL